LTLIFSNLSELHEVPFYVIICVIRLIVNGMLSIRGKNLSTNLFELANYTNCLSEP